MFEDGSPITKIGDGMFSDIYNLKSVAFPAGLNEIGKRAFESCFLDMENPGEMILPEGLKKIDDRAFSMCYFLKSVKLPSSLEHIGDHAFNMCISLESVEIPKNLTTLGDGAYSYAYVLTEFTVSPDNVVFSVDDGVLYCGDSLAAYPSGREKTDFEIKTASVSPSAFEGSNIVKVEYAVPFKLTENLFAGTNIETLRPSGSTDEGIIIPEGNTEIPKNAFHYCKEIKDVIMSDGIQCIGEHSFEGCASLTDVVLPYGVETIADSAFSGCLKMNAIVIPDTVSEIGPRAFVGCTSLTDVVLPYGVETIADSAFSGCLKMNAIVIPDTVSEIGPRAFDIGTESLCRSVYVSNNENLVIGDGAFSLKFFRIVEGAKVEIVDPYELKGNTYGFEDSVFVEQEKESEDPVESGAPATIVLPSATLPEDVRVVVNGVTLESGYEYDMKNGTVTLDTKILGKGTFTVVIINPGSGVILKNSSLEVKRPQPTPPEPKPIPVVFCKVSYDINGGSEPAPGTMTFEKGDTASVAPYIGYRDGYTFGGWQCNGKTYNAGDEFTVDSDMKFVAVWNAVPSPGPEPAPQSDSNTGVIVGAIVAAVAAVAVIGVAVYFLRNKH